MVAETLEQHTEDLTAGQRLKAAREEHNLDRNEIARWMKLDEKFIKAIEEDDEEHLPEPVFIAGYIRSYAKLVDLPSDQLVKEFSKAHQISEPKLVSPAEPVPGRLSKVAESLPKRFSIATNSHPTAVKWLVVASFAIFSIVVVSWVAVVLKGSDRQITALNETQSVVTMAAPESSITDRQDNPAVVASGDSHPATVPAAGGSGSENRANKTDEPKRITIPLDLNKIPQNKKERSDSGVVPVLTDEELATKHEIENIAVHFTADSWVDIRDATGKRLLRSLGVAGATKEVQGVAPFQVLIGYGPGVEIKYNGEPYDFSKHQGKQEVARFTLNSDDRSSQSLSGKPINDINQ